MGMPGLSGFIAEFPIFQGMWAASDTVSLTIGGFMEHRIYDGRFSYISHGNHGVEELYDHEKDPMEWRNLALDPEYRVIKARFKALVPDHNEPVAPKNPY